MLRLYQSNHLESLATRLSGLLAEPAGEALQQEQVIVQHPGMARWLSLRIAGHLGICANLSFPLPAAFIWQLFHTLLPDVPDYDRYQPKRLTWRIYRLLRDVDEKLTDPSVTGYLAGADDIKRFQLAQQLAMLFDRYLIYRPDWILKWQQGEAATEGDEWQAGLWRHLTEEDAVHWVSLQLQLSGMSTTSFQKILPPRVFIFGVPTLSPGYLEIIRHVASLIDVHLFLLNPCEAHWADIVSPSEQAQLALQSREQALYLEVGNPLLATMGRQGRDFFAAINEMDPGGEELYQRQRDDLLLHQIQNQILTLSEPQSGCSTDGSVTLHRCHSPMREVEVLYDQLLALFEDLPDLTASDILVMTPDIDRYGPLIKAHFSSPGSRPKIPFRISGGGLLQDNPLATALLEIVQLPGSRYPVGSVLNLLEYPAIRRRFGLDEEGVERVTQWLNQAAVHWGRDGESKHSLGLPTEQSNTWRSGLWQLLLGYAMQGDAGELWHHHYPLDAVEGSEGQWLGGLLAFCDALFALEDHLMIDRSSQAWVNFLIGLTEQFFSSDEESEAQLESVREAIHALAQEMQQAGIEEQIPIAPIRYRLQELLNISVDRGFMGGGVNFCALAPMRSLPFRVIALIGMNDGAFPRQQPELGFDLMSSAFRRGDRSRRADDRYLFLETLISARDRLLISYVGRSQHDNTLLPPSVVVDELCDSLQLMVAESGMKEIIFDHPLQPFSRDYFLADSTLFSYSAEMYEAAMRVGNGDRNELPLVETPLAETEGDGLIDLQQFLHFFTNPLKGFADIRLNLDLGQAGQLPEEREPFTLAHFDRLALEHELVESMLADQSPEALYEQLRARGRLPHGMAGEQTFGQMQSRAAAMVQRIQALDGGDLLQPLGVDLKFDEHRLVGHLHGVTTGGLLTYSTDRLYPYQMVRHWIRHLLLNALNPPGVTPTTCLLEGDRTGHYRSVETAKVHLDTLIRRYRQGLRLPLSFIPATAWIYQEKLEQGGEEVARKAARQRWFGNRFQPGDVDKPYHRLLRPDRPALDQTFFDTSRELLQPLMDHLEWQG
ncbi:MAG: exodeoxyribonuclease V subunit gamma [Candidatus Thiodiazotropha endolucinida]|uniref:RecBCD enzyme subunit RecC n=1 Tax=Candidatus Thiodiazotropha taylori TaxID=2792791 RepID=A0A9E4NGP5_9GAMM|nr:exodeoxyribonuclease V subunit gamma [Candidatus Thiodiazotropha taylori]MCW4234971.1 exodeoxyribonuclease V subunit gamma [Candidatus Thiodiazotropha endolucinida]